MKSLVLPRLAPRFGSPSLCLQAGIVACLAVMVTPLLLGQVIPTTNRIDWIPGVTIGVPGGIPNRTTTYVTLASGASVGTINSAISSCPSNQVVLLPAGDYTINSPILLKSGVTLRGAGPSTRLFMSLNSTIKLEGGGVMSAASPLYSGYSKGSSNIVLVAGPQVQVGSYLCLFQHDDPNLVISWDGGDYHTVFHVKVTGLSQGTNATVWPPLPYSLSASLAPQYYANTTRYIEFAGLENMQLLPDSSVNYVVTMDSAFGCWCSNVTITNIAGQSGFYTYKYLQCEIRHCAVLGSTSAGDGYGVQADVESQYHVGGNGLWIENNIFSGLYHGVILSGTVGSAVSFNVTTNEHSNAGVSWATAGYNGTHAAGGMMVLWEGNFGNYWWSDKIHGNCTHQTFFRNRFHGLSSAVVPCVNAHGCMFDFDQGSYWYSAVGNVLGDWWATNTSKYYYEVTGPQWDAASSCDNGAIWMLGYVGYGSPLDPKVRSTMLRYQNYDYWNRSVQSDSGLSGTIGSSMLYATKPAWFGDRPWPAFDPATALSSSSILNLPAGYRLLTGSDPGSGGSVNQPPIAAAAADKASGLAPLTVTFSSAGSSDPEGAPLTYSWTFGDGTSSTNANPAHIYQTAGSYVAQLAVSDGTNSTLSAPIAITVQSGQPVAAYGFEEGVGTTVADASGNSNTGVISGAVWTNGYYGKALAFDGTNAIMTVSNSSSLALTTGLTLEAWVYPKAFNGNYQSIVVMPMNSTFSQISYVLHGAARTSGVPSFALSITSANLNGPTALPLNTWSHLAATYDGSMVRLFVNGVQVAAQAQTGSIATSTQPLRIGMNWPGLIDEVRIYNRALSATEIQNDMQQPLGPRPSPPTNLRVL